MSQPITPKQRTTIYIDSNILKEFQIICSREETNVSKKIESFAAKYVAVHRKGNPQLRLEPFIGKLKKQCFRCEGMFPSLISVRFISGLKAQVCHECLEDYQRRHTVKKVLGQT